MGCSPLKLICDASNPGNHRRRLWSSRSFTSAGSPVMKIVRTFERGVKKRLERETEGERGGIYIPRRRRGEGRCRRGWRRAAEGAAPPREGEDAAAIAGGGGGSGGDRGAPWRRRNPNPSFRNRRRRRPSPGARFFSHGSARAGSVYKKRIVSYYYAP